MTSDERRREIAERLATALFTPGLHYDTAERMAGVDRLVAIGRGERTLGIWRFETIRDRILSALREAGQAQDAEIQRLKRERQTDCLRPAESTPESVPAESDANGGDRG